MAYQHIIATRKGGPEVLEIQTDELRDPGPGEALVKVQRAGVAFGDLLWMSGVVPGSPKPPFTPGYDVVGTVESLGPGAAGFTPGQTIIGLIKIGGYSEYAYVPLEKMIAVPEGLDPTEAAALTLNYLTALQLFQRVTPLKAGQCVLVHGASGAVGTALLQVGGLIGLEMYGTASPAKHEIVAGLGATPIDYRNEDFVERIARLTGDGVDLVVDHIGGDHLKRSFETLRAGGLLVSTSAYGSVRGNTSAFENMLGFILLPLWNLWPNGKRAMLFDVVPYNNKNPSYLGEDLTILLSYLAEGKLKPIIDRQLPLREARRAQELLLNGEANGKVILICNED
jgi:NADPH:quinone reductase-like Zn-dependent oxidoreductase